MKTVKDLMTPACYWISPEKSVADAAKMMKEYDIGFLPVGEDDRLIGTLTDRDITIRIVAAKKDPQEIPVREAMTKKLYYCFEDQAIDEACKNMAAMQIRRLPVVSKAKKLVGVVSFADLSRAASPAVFTACEKQITTKPGKAAKPANAA